MNRPEIENLELECAFAHFWPLMVLVFNKPYGVLSQFTPDGSKNRPLSEFGMPKEVYAVGRLDADSEGLLILSDEPELNHLLLHPARGHERTYWVQVERIPTAASLEKLQKGIPIQDYRTLPSRARILDPQPNLPPRVPPIRFRKTVPDVWVEITLIEGKNRQVRRMTAEVGHPTLRLLRVSIGQLRLDQLSILPGQWRLLEKNERELLLS